MDALLVLFGFMSFIPFLGMSFFRGFRDAAVHHGLGISKDQTSAATEVSTIFIIVVVAIIAPLTLTSIGGRYILILLVFAAE